MQYTFRCILDVHDDVIRDIAINASASLLDLHEAVVQNFGLSLGEIAAFYRTNEDWEQGEEIPIFDMSNLGASNEMKDYMLSDVFKNTGDKFLYVYDFLNMWTFFIELSQTDKKKDIDTPIQIFSIGNIPEQAPEKHFVSENISDDIDDELDCEFEDDYDTDEDLSNLY